MKMGRHRKLIVRSAVLPIITIYIQCIRQQPVLASSLRFLDSGKTAEFIASTVIDPFKPSNYAPEEVVAYQKRTDAFLDSLFNRNRNRNLAEVTINEFDEAEDCADGEICKNGYKYFETDITYVSNNFPVNNQGISNNRPEVGDGGSFTNDVYNQAGKYIGEMRGTCIFDEDQTLHATCLFTIVFFDKFGVEMGQLQFQGGGGNFLFEISSYVANNDDTNGLSGPQVFSVTGGTGCFSGADGQAVFTNPEKRFQVYLYRYWYHQYYYYNN